MLRNEGPVKKSGEFVYPDSCDPAETLRLILGGVAGFDDLILKLDLKSSEIG